MKYAALCAILLLAGCADTQIVKVPVPVKAEVPAELQEPFKPSVVPVFISPSDPSATSCLAPSGERDLKSLLLESTARIDALEAWGGISGTSSILAPQQPQ